MIDKIKKMTKQDIKNIWADQWKVLILKDWVLLDVVMLKGNSFPESVDDVLPYANKGFLCILKGPGVKPDGTILII